MQGCDVCTNHDLAYGGCACGTNGSLQRFKTHNELEIGAHSFGRLMKENKFHSVSNDSLDLMSVKSRLNISQLN